MTHTQEEADAEYILGLLKAHCTPKSDNAFRWVVEELQAHNARIRLEAQLAILNDLDYKCRPPRDDEDVRVLIMKYIKDLQPQLSPIQPNKQEKP